MSLQQLRCGAHEAWPTLSCWAKHDTDMNTEVVINTSPGNTDRPNRRIKIQDKVTYTPAALLREAPIVDFKRSHFVLAHHPRPRCCCCPSCSRVYYYGHRKIHRVGRTRCTSPLAIVRVPWLHGSKSTRETERYWVRVNIERARERKPGGLQPDSTHVTRTQNHALKQKRITVTIKI